MKAAVAFAAILCLAGVCEAGSVLLDWSPTTTGGSGTSYLNEFVDQHWAELVTFSTDTVIDGMDQFGHRYAFDNGELIYGRVGDAAIIRIWADAGGLPGDLLYEFTEALSIVDQDGTAGIAGVDRRHVDFSSPVTFLGGVAYWIGLSGPGLDDLPQLGLATNVPGDGTMVRFVGDQSGGAHTVGDMAFRLYGTSTAVVPEPGSLALLALGGVGLVAGRYRRRQGR